MSKWTQYQSVFELSRREFKRYCINHGKPKSWTREDKMVFLRSVDAEMLNDGEANKYREDLMQQVNLTHTPPRPHDDTFQEFKWGGYTELAWRKCNRHTIFAESTRLCEMLLKSKLAPTIDQLTHLQNYPNGLKWWEFDSHDREGVKEIATSFTISLPDVSIGGFNLIPLLYTITADRCISVTSRIRFGFPATTHFNTDDVLNSAIDLMSQKDMFDKEVERRGKDIERSTEIVDRAMGYAYSVAIGLRLMAYICSTENYIEGVPEDLRRMLPPPPKSGNMKRSVIREPSETRGKASVHWRSGHFRTYHADCYKKDARGFDKVGWVNGAVIGRDRAHTAIEDRRTTV